jgi:CheY-like chemotaxis protein
MEPSGRAAIECLLAEDDPAEVQHVRDALPAMPLPVHLHMAEDGEQAAAFLQRHGAYASAPRPDLVILDASLPKRGGEDVLTSLTGNPILQTVPVFVALEFAGEREHVRRQGLPPAHYLLKPLVARQLLQALCHESLRDRSKEIFETTRETIAYAQATREWARQVRQEAQEFRQYRRAWAERKAAQQALPPQASTVAADGFLRMADVMRDELQNFFTVLHRGKDTDALRRATEGLQQVLSRYEPLVSNSEQRNSLPVEQRWGFLLLLSNVQSARAALKALAAPPK